MLNWNSLLNGKRLGASQASDISKFRSEFQRDFDRIIFSSAFRRLQDKTQVFPMPVSDFVHSRLTHSIEVSSLGRTLGNLAGDFILGKEKDLANLGVTMNIFGDIVAAASLAHDVGNPPFGHSGEKAISDFFKKNSSRLNYVFKKKIQSNCQNIYQETRHKNKDRKKIQKTLS